KVRKDKQGIIACIQPEYSAPAVLVFAQIKTKDCWRMQMNKTVIYSAPEGAVGSKDYRVRVRAGDEAWQELFVYEVQVDMHDVRKASMAYFDREGIAEIEIECLYTEI